MHVTGTDVITSGCVLSNGGYVFDNFPQTRDQWTLLLEKGPDKGIMPDDVVYLRDESDHGDFLTKRLVSCGIRVRVMWIYRQFAVI